MASKELRLPPLPSGKALEIENDARQILVVGANGAGKTRFTAWMADNAGAKAFCLSALEAIFNRPAGASGNAVIDTLFDKAFPKETALRAGTSQLERVLKLLMHDEMLNLLHYKLAVRDNPATKLQHTGLDSVIDLWKQIFPGNNILVESGRMLFSREGYADAGTGYSTSLLSAGEKAALYYLAAMTYAPKRSIVFIDSPEMFLHPTVMRSLFNHIEQTRPDCRFVYTTHDLDFAASRSASSTIWVRSFDPAKPSWDYQVLPPTTVISDEIYRSILGSRKPVLFIEGDERRSIDAKLYPLIFRDFTVQPLGSCNKVIEATRTFNDLNSFHHMDSRGIVDRDRRDAREVDYLRSKRIMVPEVAEVENLLLVEEVIRTVASWCGKDEEAVARKVKRYIVGEFRTELRRQALMHTRHKVKRLVECRIDGRFPDIETLEEHMASLPRELNPRGLYNNYCREFQGFVARNDYASILKVFNQKSMLPGSNVASLCGLHDKDDYLYTILKILRSDTPAAERIRRAVIACFNIDPHDISNED